MSRRHVLVLLILLYGARMTAQEVSLDTYVQTATIRSPLLRELRNTVRSATIDSQLIRAAYKPQIGLTTFNSFAPANNRFGYDAAVTNGGQFSTLAGVNQAFASRYNLRTQYQSAALTADSARVATAISGQDLIRAVTAQYLTTFGDQQQLIALTEINRLLVNEGTLLKHLTQNNFYRQTDYLTFLVTQNQQELQLKQTHIQYLTDFANLNYLCGIIDTAVSTKILTLPQLEPLLFPDMLSSVFFQKYHLDSLRLVNNVKLVNLAYRPKLGIFADAGYSTSVLRTFYNNFGASGGFSVSVPIYDGRRRRLYLRQIALQEDTRVGYRDFFFQQYREQLAGLAQQLSATDVLLRDINEQIQYAKGLIDVNEKLLQTGDARIPDFVIAINNYLTAKTLLTQNRISRLQLINQINYWNR